MSTYNVKKAIIWLLATALLGLISHGTAIAQSARQPSTCLAIAENGNNLPILKAAYQFAQSSRPFIMPEVTIRYATHSTFRIQSPEGVVIATDYASTAGEGRLPDVITMNHAHGTHYTSVPDKQIKTVLRGWAEQFGEKAEHYITIGDTLIRNVPTDIYSGDILIEKNGNSIFIFEMAGLCIGHVGHLHHTLTPELIGQIGRLDIVMVPVDGSVTMSLEGMAEIARQFRSSIILPMHWFSSFSLQSFMTRMSSQFQTRFHEERELKVSLASLPRSPTVIAMTPEGSNDIDGFD